MRFSRINEYVLGLRRIVVWAHLLGRETDMRHMSRIGVNWLTIRDTSTSFSLFRWGAISGLGLEFLYISCQNQAFMLAQCGTIDQVAFRRLHSTNISNSASPSCFRGLRSGVPLSHAVFVITYLYF